MTRLRCRIGGHRYRYVGTFGAGIGAVLLRCECGQHAVEDAFASGMGETFRHKISDDDAEKMVSADA